MMQADIPLAPRRIKGKEQYIVAGGKHKTVTVYDVEGRVTPSQLSEKFDAQSEKYDQFRIFLRVRNLQSLPSGLEGCSLYLHLEVKLVLVIKGGWARAWVQQIYPETNKPVIFLTTLLQEAYFLQLQVGEPLGEFNHLAMKEPRREVGPAGKIVAVVDANGFSKHRVQGPDIYQINNHLSEAQQKILGRNPWLEWHTGKTHIIPRQVTLATVAVVYVHAKDVGSYTKILTFVEGGKERPGIITIPAAKTIPTSSNT